MTVDRENHDEDEDDDDDYVDDDDEEEACQMRSSIRAPVQDWVSPHFSFHPDDVRFDSTHSVSES